MREWISRDKAVQNGMEMDLPNACRYEADLFDLSFTTADQKEGMNVFLENVNRSFPANRIGLLFMHKKIVTLLFFFLVVIPFHEAFSAIYPSMSGTVVDATTGKPVQGASVLVYWTKLVLRPPIEPGTELIEARLVETDQDGSYQISGILKLLGPFAFKGDTVLVVYQPGYRVHIVNEHRGGSKDIKNDGNLIKLSRVTANFDYGKHHNEISDALWGINDRSYMSFSSTSWSNVKNNAMRGLPEKEKLLRRAYWEYERSRKRYEP